MPPSAHGFPHRLTGTISWSPAGVLVLVLAAATLSAQEPTPPPQPGMAPGREFTLVQRSYWVSNEMDASAVSPAETTLVAPDSAAAADSLTARRYGSLPPTLAAWLTLARRAGAAAWRDTLQYRYARDNDTLVLRWTRAARTLDAPPSGQGEWRRLGSATQVSIEAWSTIETRIDPPGVRVRTQLSGSMEEQLLYHPATGQVDSVHARGTLRGRRIFLHPNGRADTISGRWVVAQDACWFIRPDSAAAIWIGDAGYLDAMCPAPGESRRTFWPLADRAARGDTAALDSLFAQRRRETDPLRQAPAEYLTLSDAGSGPFVRRAIAAYRPGDADLLLHLLWRAGFWLPEGLDDPALAGLLARELRDLRHERAAGIDRAQVLTGLWYHLQRRPPVSAAVARLFARAAEETNDPRARDAFLLGAYRTAPDRSAALLDRLADRDGWVWGYARGASPPADTTAFPGVAAPWQAHTRWLASPYRDDKVGALRVWFVAHRANPIRAFRNRFASEADTSGRFVWAEYLLALGDTTPASWLVRLAEADRPVLTFGLLIQFQKDSLARRIYVRRDSLAKSAFGLLWRYRSVVADTVRDPAMVTGAQVQVLGCDAPAAGDREPELLLQSSVTPEAIDRCRQRYRPLGSDSLQRMADRDRQAVATVVSPLLRIGNGYVMDVTTDYWTRRNEPCLCGAGKRYLLTYRDGRWSAVVISSWIV